MRNFKYIVVLTLFLLSVVVVVGCNKGDQALEAGNSESTEQTSNVEEDVDKETQIYASIDGKKISEDELKYECFRLELQNALSNRPINDCPPDETLISQIIELHAINYLADLKGVAATEDEVQQKIQQLKQDLDSSPIFKEQIGTYDEEKFWNYEKERYFTLLNIEKVKERLVEEEKETHSYYDEESLKLTAQKEFEDLIVEAVGLIETTIFYH